VGHEAIVIFDLALAVVSERLTHITETSKSRLKDRISMLLEPMTATSSSTEKCLECNTNGAG
jgi:hypothetical protein